LSGVIVLLAMQLSGVFMTVSSNNRHTAVACGLFYHTSDEQGLLPQLCLIGPICSTSSWAPPVHPMCLRLGFGLGLGSGKTSRGPPSSCSSSSVCSCFRSCRPQAANSAGEDEQRDGVDTRHVQVLLSRLVDLNTNWLDELLKAMTVFCTCSVQHKMVKVR